MMSKVPTKCACLHGAYQPIVWWNVRYYFHRWYSEQLWSVLRLVIIDDLMMECENVKLLT